MGKRRANGAKTIRTLKELGALVGRDTGTVSRWTKHRDWTFGKSPWNRSRAADILRWAAEHLAEGASLRGPKPDSQGQDLRKQKLLEEIRKLRANADQAETALARERGQLIAAEDAEQEWTAIAVRIRNSFQTLGSQLTPLALAHGMPHQNASEFQQQIEESVAAILRTLSRDSSAQDDSDSSEEVLSSPVTSGTVETIGVGGELPSPQ